MIITVTQDDIDNGCPALPGNCAVSKAINRHTGKKITTHINSFGILSTDGCSVTAIYKLPSNAKEFIRNYDRGLPVAPFSFEIEGLEMELVK